MSNEVVVPQRSAIFSKPMLGLVGYSPGMLGAEIPEARISGRENAGQYRLLKNFYPKLECVLVAAHPVRIYLQGPVDKPKTVCASVFGRVPLPEIEHPMARSCLECAYGQWQEGAGGRRVQPCMLCHAMLFILPAESDRPFWYVPRKGAAGVAQRFLNELRGTPGLEAFSQLQITLTTQKKQDGAKSWYEPIFTVKEELLPKEQYADLTAAAVEGCRYTPRVDGVSSTANGQDVIDVPGETLGPDSSTPF
jgi:hypothetical protein